MRILLIGKSGQLGGSLLRQNESHEICAPERNELDIESRESCAGWIESFRPQFAINTTGFHDLQQCEAQPRRAFEVNSIAVADLAALCERANVQLLTFSTDYVFDGNKHKPYCEDDPTNPLQIYGVSKLAGELAALRAAPRHASIIRTCGLYGLGGSRSRGGNFVTKRIADAQRLGRLEVACDQVVVPTFTDDLAKAIFELIEAPAFAPDIYHLVNEGECSWHEFTVAICRAAGIDADVAPVERGSSSDGFQRPLYSVLDNARARALGVTLPPWRDALERYVYDEIRTDGSKAP